MNASYMLVYLIIRLWSQGKIIRMSQSKICHKVRSIFKITVIINMLVVNKYPQPKQLLTINESS